jgi:hypothetical protein
MTQGEKTGEVNSTGAHKQMARLPVEFSTGFNTSILLTYLRSWALLEKLPIMQPLKNFPEF